MINHTTHGCDPIEYERAIQASQINVKNHTSNSSNNKKRKSEESEQDSSKKNKASSFDTEGFLECLECPISKEPYSRKELKGAVQLFPCGHTMSEEWAIKLLGPLNKDDFLDNKKSTCSFGCKKHVITYASNLAIMALVDRVSTKAETELFSKKLDLASSSSSSSSSNSSSSTTSSSITQDKEKMVELPFPGKSGVFIPFETLRSIVQLTSTSPDSLFEIILVGPSKDNKLGLSMTCQHTDVIKIELYFKQQGIIEQAVYEKIYKNKTKIIMVYHTIEAIRKIFELIKKNNTLPDNGKKIQDMLDNYKP